MKARFIYSLTAALLLAGNLAPRTFAEEVRREPLAKASIFLPFDFYGRHREELGLNEEQARELKQLAASLREPAQKVETERAQRTKALLEAMSQRPVEIEDTMARFQAVLDAENELKALQFRAGLEMRNALNPDQLRKVELFATKDAAARSGIHPGLNERIQQLRGEIQKRSGSEPPKAVLGQLKQIEQTAREGRSGEAKAQLEELLKQLRQESEPVAEPKAPTKQKESPR